MVIIGLDTALRCTGYGVINVEGKQIAVVDCGVIKNPKSAPHSECLRRVVGGVQQIIDTFSPELAAIEGGFFARNAKTSMVLGMARGAVVSTLATHAIPTFEYAPRRVKQAVVGYGNATKEQVAECISRLVSIDVKDVPDDATDGIAIALCHALTAQSANGLYLPDPL